MIELGLTTLIEELERLTALVLVAVEQKEYQDFMALQPQYEKCIDLLLVHLTSEVLPLLLPAQRSRLQALVSWREKIQLGILCWSEEIRDELVVINQNARVMRRYSR